MGGEKRGKLGSQAKYDTVAIISQDGQPSREILEEGDLIGVRAVPQSEQDQQSLALAHPLLDQVAIGGID